MIGKLRIKLVLVIMGSLILIFGAVFTALNLAVHFDSLRQTERLLNMIAENDGFFLPQRNGNERLNSFSAIYSNFEPDDMRARRFFYVKIDENGSIFEADFKMMFDFSESDAKTYIAQAVASGESEGGIGYFNFLSKEKEYGHILVFAERRVEMGMLSRLTEMSLIVAGISCLALLALSIWLSKWMVAPVKEAIDKQRRFISDANHELKTPLTIISANVDVLKNEVGDNERIIHIKTQIARMGKLIHNLLNLSKIEDYTSNAVHSKFDLSALILNTTLEFESRMFEEGREYSYDICKDIMHAGDEDKMKQLLSILIDNAIQHSNRGSFIKVELKMESGHPRLSVRNTGTGIPDCERSKIFDRFYRSDDSRARETGGYGLGLSIAKSIVDAQKGNIKVIGEYGKWVEFIAMLN
jgi:nitrogen-specific signal transduction histidine kinase